MQLFGLKGFHATSMQDIADAVGLQKGSLYHYISSKEELLAGIMAEALAKYNSRLQAIVESDMPIREKVTAAIRTHFLGIAENLDMLTIFFRESYALTPEQAAEVNRGTKQYNDMFERLLAEAMDAGVLRKQDPKLTCRVVLGACNWFYRWYRPEGPRSLEQLADFFVDTLLNGIALPERKE
jgi:AcrR family transcriptional regulator